MQKAFLILTALLLFAFYSFGFYQWLLSGHNFTDVWRAIRSDWFLMVTVLDLSLFALLCLVWMYRDMKARNFRPATIILILLATLVSGVVVLLLYLAFRKKLPPSRLR